MACTYRVFRRPVRAGRAVFWLLMPELLLTVAVLALFALEQPNLYRTLFWQIGYDHGLNSNPAMVLYAYANHRPLPNVPFVWSQTLTNFNEAISIASLFVLITKMIGLIMDVYYPVVGAFVALVMTALYTTSIVGQAGPDYADARYPSSSPWYLRYGCSFVQPYGATVVGYCQMAKATLAVTVLMMLLYLTNLVLMAWSLLPNHRIGLDEDADKTKFEEAWEMQVPPQTPGTARSIPFTPRTQALRTLDRRTGFGFP